MVLSTSIGIKPKLCVTRTIVVIAAQTHENIEKQEGCGAIAVPRIHLDSMGMSTTSKTLDMIAEE